MSARSKNSARPPISSQILLTMQGREAGRSRNTEKSVLSEVEEAELDRGLWKDLEGLSTSIVSKYVPTEATLLPNP